MPSLPHERKSYHGSLSSTPAAPLFPLRCKQQVSLNISAIPRGSTTSKQSPFSTASTPLFVIVSDLVPWSMPFLTAVMRAGTCWRLAPTPACCNAFASSRDRSYRKMQIDQFAHNTQNGNTTSSTTVTTNTVSKPLTNWLTNGALYETV